MSEQDAQKTVTPEPAAATPEPDPGILPTPWLSKSNAIIAVLVLVIVLLIAANIGSDETPESAEVSQAVPTPAPASVASTPAPVISKPAAQAVMASDGIDRYQEGKLFYTSIRIPANAETLYLSGSGATKKADGSYGNMEEQAISTFTKFKDVLESQGWSMKDVVQVRAFAIAGDYGLLDFDGFNRGYSRFFGTPENPNKPVRSFVQVANLVVDGWLVEIEIRAARLPKDS